MIILNIESYRDFCLALPFTSEEFPFDQSTLVFKVAGKMFALTDVDDFQSVNLKCNPEIALDLREKYVDVLPGYHMNKRHWNTVRVNGEVSDELLFSWIKDSYDLVVQSLTKKLRTELGL